MCKDREKNRWRRSRSRIVHWKLRATEDAVLVRITLTRKADALFDLNRYEEAEHIYRDAAKLALGNNEQILQLSRKLAACFAARERISGKRIPELRKQIGGSLESSNKQLSRVLLIERELAKLRRVAIRNKILREQEGARRIALSESLRQLERQRKEIIRLEQQVATNSRDSVLLGGKGSCVKPGTIPIRDLALRFPTLSKTELHICDLIRKSGFQRKEIASLLDPFSSHGRVASCKRPQETSSPAELPASGTEVNVS